jgi:N-acetylmuramoyl-L-alanine amidase
MMHGGTDDQRRTRSRSAARLRARILSDALEDNLDVIHGRLPASLRPARRFLRLWARRLTLAAAVLVASVGLALWPAAAPAARTEAGASPAAVRTATAAPDGARAAPGGSLKASVLSQPTPPGVLDLTVRRVIIDAGHGGDNPGTSSASGLKEKDLTLDIAARVQKMLAARGFDIVMTRTGDETLSLQERAATANAWRGDIFVSIHLNSLQRPSDRGIETYYLGPSGDADREAVAAVENQQSGYSLADMRSLLERIYTDARRDESRRLATAIQKSLMEMLERSEPGITDRGVKMAPFVVLGATEMPAILAEVSCLSNEDEANRLKTAEARQRIAEALVSGIQTFAGKSHVR